MSRMSTEIGRVLGRRYRIIAPIGMGASAQVFLADDVRLRRRVAVKMLHAALADDADFLRRFHAEAQAAAALNHPNVLSVFDWGDDDQQPFLVTEFLGGGSLRAMLDAGERLSTAQALRVGLEATRALDYAHRRGLVHRDIKPANLLFGEEGRLRIADFGLARALAEAAWTEPQGAVLGTARYASPEQAQGEALTSKSDVYSLALVVVESVTGSVPFAADTTIGTLMARVNKPLSVPDELGPLAEPLRRAGLPDPEERLDAHDLGVALMAAASQLERPARLPLAGALATASDDADQERDPTLIPGSGAAAVAVVAPSAMATGAELEGNAADEAALAAAEADAAAPGGANDPAGLGTADPWGADDDTTTLGPLVGGVAAGAAFGAAVQSHLAEAEAADLGVGGGEPGDVAAPDPDGEDGPHDEAPPDELAVDVDHPDTDDLDADADDFDDEGEYEDEYVEGGYDDDLEARQWDPADDGEDRADDAWAAAAAPVAFIPAPEPPGEYDDEGVEYDEYGGYIDEHGIHHDAEGFEEYDDYEEQPRRRAWLVGILLLLLLAGAVIGGLAIVGASEEGIKRVPPLVGLQLTAAKEKIKDYGWEIRDSHTRKDDTKPGQVLSVTPAAGTRMRKGKTITFLVSDGPTLVDVPMGVRNQTQGGVEALYKAIGLKTTVTTAFDEDIAPGNVIGLAPGVPAKLPKGDTVGLIVSNGPAPRTIPEGLAGLSYGDAAQKLTDLRLNPVEVDQYNDDKNVKAGQVFDTDPKADTQVPRDSNVTLYVSAGPTPIAIPNVAGQTPAAATQALGALGFYVVTAQEFSDTVANGVVIGTRPAYGSTAQAGTTITIVVSKGPDLVVVPSVVGTTTPAQASQILVNAGLTPGSLSGKATGKPIATTPAAGTSVKRGSVVNIILG